MTPTNCTYADCDEPGVTMLVMEHFGFMWAASACSAHVTHFVMLVSGGLN